MRAGPSEPTGHVQATRPALRRGASRNTCASHEGGSEECKLRGGCVSITLAEPAGGLESPREGLSDRRGPWVGFMSSFRAL